MGVNLIEAPVNSLLQVTLRGIVILPPAFTTQVLLSAGAIVTGAPSERLTETGTSATSRGFGISWLASFTGQTIEARRPGRVTVLPSIRARPWILATRIERGAFSSAL